LAHTGKILFSAPDTRPSLQQAARALHEVDLLGGYYTTLAFSDTGPAIRGAEFVDGVLGSRLATELRRRAIREFPSSLVRRFPLWDIPRTLLSKFGVAERVVDRLHDRSLTSLDHHVAANINGFSGVYAVNLAARAAFSAAKERNICCVYEVLNLEPRSYIQMLRQEFEKFPELFASEPTLQQTVDRFVERTDAEWALADLIIVNSKLARDSHAEAGMDVAKVLIAPLGFPPIRANERTAPPATGPLRALWAGTFSIRKGAHYLLAAMKSSSLRGRVTVDVFGRQLLPPQAVAGLDNITFHGTVPHTHIFAEYQRADVLVLPTLSDGFAMAVSEAMSQGIPVITTTSAGAAEFIDPGVNGLIVPPFDSEALVNALVWCAEHKPDLHDMGIRARETAARWQWSNYRNVVANAVSGCLQAQALRNTPR
jgi:glycosyltransferase involved in cell wall biosynthesis